MILKIVVIYEIFLYYKILPILLLLYIVINKKITTNKNEDDVSYR